MSWRSSRAWTEWNCAATQIWNVTWTMELQPICGEMVQAKINGAMTRWNVGATQIC